MIKVAAAIFLFIFVLLVFYYVYLRLKLSPAENRDIWFWSTTCAWFVAIFLIVYLLMVAPVWGLAAIIIEIALVGFLVVDTMDKLKRKAQHEKFKNIPIINVTGGPARRFG